MDHAEKQSDPAKKGAGINGSYLRSLKAVQQHCRQALPEVHLRGQKVRCNVSASMAQVRTAQRRRPHLDACGHLAHNVLDARLARSRRGVVVHNLRHGRLARQLEQLEARPGHG